MVLAEIIVYVIIITAHCWRFHTHTHTHTHARTLARSHAHTDRARGRFPLVLIVAYYCLSGRTTSARKSWQLATMSTTTSTSSCRQTPWRTLTTTSTSCSVCNTEQARNLPCHFRNSRGAAWPCQWRSKLRTLRWGFLFGSMCVYLCRLKRKGWLGKHIDDWLSEWLTDPCVEDIMQTEDCPVIVY